MKKLTILSKLLIAVLVFAAFGCNTSSVKKISEVDTLVTTPVKEGISVEIKFTKGPEHNHPLMAIWIEDTSGKYLHTLYVAESIAKGIFKHGDKSQGKWLPGAIRRPAALPVWSHKRGVLEEDGLYIPTVKTAMPDAVTGATPSANFILQTKVPYDIPAVFYVFFEINQPWDWNAYWNNNKFPDNEDYKTSCQPALVYRAKLSTANELSTAEFELIGHSHYSGKNGEIYSELETITTAKEITQSLNVSFFQ